MAKVAECELVLCSTLVELIREKRELAFVYCKGIEDTDDRKLAKEHYVMVADDTPLENFLTSVQRVSLPSEPVLIICYEASGVHQAAHIWWRLKCVGRNSVAVLEGGAEAWRLHPGTSEVVLPSVSAGTRFECMRIDHYMKCEAEVEEQRSVPGWEYQVILTEKTNSLDGLHFEPNLVFTSIGRFEEPGFLREIVVTAGIDLRETCQSIVFGEHAETLLLGLAILGKRNLCLGVENVAEDLASPQSPRMNFSIVKDDFFTAREEDEFFDALGESRRESAFYTTKNDPELSDSHSTTEISAPKTDLKRLMPNSSWSGGASDMRTMRKCQCLLM